MKIAQQTQTKETKHTAYVFKKQAHSAVSSAEDKKARPKEETDVSNVQEEEEGATVAISAEGLGLAQKKKEEDDSAKEAMERDMYQEMLEKANEAAEAQGEGFAELAKALEIARRILNGDIVPAQDEQFLMEFNSEIYMRVKSMAKEKDDPKEYDTLMEEEEENTDSADGTDESGSGGLTIKSGQQEGILE